MTGQAVLVVVAGLLVLWAGYRLLSSSVGTCRQCGWDQGSVNCQMAHSSVEAERMWTRREWETYQRTGRLPAWDHSRERGE